MHIEEKKYLNYLGGYQMDSRHCTRKWDQSHQTNQLHIKCLNHHMINPIACVRLAGG